MSRLAFLVVFSFLLAQLCASTLKRKRTDRAEPPRKRNRRVGNALFLTTLDADYMLNGGFGGAATGRRTSRNSADSAATFHRIVVDKRRRGRRVEPVVEEEEPEQVEIKETVLEEEGQVEEVSHEIFDDEEEQEDKLTVKIDDEEIVVTKKELLLPTVPEVTPEVSDTLVQPEEIRQENESSRSSVEADIEEEEFVSPQPNEPETNQAHPATELSLDLGDDEELDVASLSQYLGDSVNLDFGFACNTFSSVIPGFSLTDFMPRSQLIADLPSFGQDQPANDNWTGWEFNF